MKTKFKKKNPAWDLSRDQPGQNTWYQADKKCDQTDMVWDQVHCPEDTLIFASRNPRTSKDLDPSHQPSLLPSLHMSPHALLFLTICSDAAYLCSLTITKYIYLHSSLHRLPRTSGDPKKNNCRMMGEYFLQKQELRTLVNFRVKFPSENIKHKSDNKTKLSCHISLFQIYTGLYSRETNFSSLASHYPFIFLSFFLISGFCLFCFFGFIWFCFFLTPLLAYAVYPRESLLIPA